MKEFFRGLGEKVQNLLDRIFGKKETQPQKESTCTHVNSNYLSFGPGEIFIDGQPFGQVKSITSLSRDEVTSEQWDNILSLFGDGNTNYTQVSFSAQPEIQENFFNIPLTLLPKRYPCKALILSLAANQPYDYQAVDMSQYEERKIAHFIVGRTCGVEQMMEEYLAEVKNNLSPEEMEEEQEWLEEMMEQALTNGMYSTFIGEATLLHYETLDVWDFEDQEED
jgi:hypothetical protein